MHIIEVTQKDLDALAELTADFRVALKSYKGISAKPNPDAAREELSEYLAAGFPIYAMTDGDELAGYIVCRIDEPCVWVESIYTKPEYRGQGVASALFAKAEELAHDRGEDTVYNYVHPNNHKMLQFLRSRGYTVLNLISHF